LTAIDLKNQVGGQREAFRICLALADLKSGLIVAKGVARAQVEGIDQTPLPHLQEAPTWAKDPAVDAYVRTCQTTKPGDRIDPAYLDGILAASLIAEASALQDRGRYQDAIEVYRSALSTPKGDQLRVHNGIYSASWKLGKRADAEQAFGRRWVGLASNRLVSSCSARLDRLQRTCARARSRSGSRRSRAARRRSQPA
jgi:tetratricopeptide (TPR) repeat protein